jgi:hypothetical protein
MTQSSLFDEKTFEHHQRSQERLSTIIWNARDAYEQSMGEYVFG